jgi:hypothetical protein
MPTKLYVHLRRPDSGSTDHLHPIGIPMELPIETTFYGVKEYINSAEGPLPSVQRLELELKTRCLETTLDRHLHRRVLYITLKDDETFLSNPFVYDQLMNSSVRRVTFIVKTFEGDLDAENIGENLSIFRNHDIAYTESDQAYYNFLVNEYKKVDYVNEHRDYERIFTR